MRVLGVTPLFLLLWAVYNGLLLTSEMPIMLERGLFTVSLLSGAAWTMSVSDLLIAAGIFLLYIEIFKATRTSVSSVINHTLSTLVFVAFLVEFISVAEAGTSTFFILLLMSLIDVLAGFTVTIVSARRDFALGDRANL